MRPWQTALALVACAPLCLSLLPVAPVFRFAGLGLSVLIIVYLFALRMKAHRVGAKRKQIDDTWERVERMRADRSRRYGRHR